MALLVTMAAAVRHLKLPIDPVATPDDDQVLDLSDKLWQAQAIVLDYLKNPDPLWVDDITTPPVVQAAILLQLGELWRFRGDDPVGQGGDQPLEYGQLSPAVTNLLRRYRDPALA